MDRTRRRDNPARVVLQRLESLERAGVQQLPRVRAAAVPSPTPTPSPTPLPAAVPVPTAAPARAEHAPGRAERAPAPARPPAPTPPAASGGETGPSKPPLSKTPLDSPDEALASLASAVAACRRCEHLACTRTQTVFGVGTHRPRLCFFGEAPGADEDRQGEPFVGRAGKLLTDIIEKGMKLRRSDVYILNVLKCRPPDNRTPSDDEIANCREYFERQFALLQPEFICCLGATATKALLNSSSNLGKMRGTWFTYQGARVIVTYHPSYLLRNPPAKKDTWNDIQLLMREMGLPVEPS